MEQIYQNFINRGLSPDQARANAYAASNALPLPYDIPNYTAPGQVDTFGDTAVEMMREPWSQAKADWSRAGLSGPGLLAGGSAGINALMALGGGGAGLLAEAVPDIGGRGADQNELAFARDFMGFGDAYAGAGLGRGMNALDDLVDAGADGLAYAGRGAADVARRSADAIPSEALYAGRSLAEGDMRGVLDAFAPSRPAQGLGAEAVEAFDVKRSDASQIFGEGSERVRYTDPQTGGTMEIVARPDQSASVLDLQVPESSRGKGIGQSLQARVMQDYPKMGGQVSSKAAATTAYRLGRRPYGNPNATLDDVFAAIDDMSSVNLVSPTAQPSPAREVAGLLSSGRANEVTDEMLAKFAPKDEMEMFDLYQRGATGMELPMDEASRMARASHFSPALHGTGADITAVDPSFFGNGQDLLGTGFYTTTAPSRADRYVPREKTSGIEVSKEYAEGGNVIPLMVREDNPFMLDEPLGDAAKEIADIYADDPFFKVDRMSSGVNVVKDADGNSVMLDPYQQRHWALQNMRKAYGPQDTSGVLSEAGYSGVSGPESSGNRVRLAYDPSSIRSRFARFDPRLAHLRNLSAGIGGAGLLSTMMPREEQY